MRIKTQKHSAFTSKFRAFRLCHWFFFLRVWKGFSGSWYMTKGRLFGEIWLWQAFLFINHILRTFFKLYKILIIFWKHFSMDLKQISEWISELISLQIFDFWTDFWTNLTVFWEDFRTFLWTNFQADYQTHFWTNIQKYLQTFHQKFQKNIFRKNTRQLFEINFKNKATTTGQIFWLGFTVGLYFFMRVYWKNIVV